ncbi:MAG: pantoate--beta-alanine ligase [Chitinophagaceae bacterium]|nr:pantoate--beta-alanine ligase [Chitinophagaceae bacterium]
MLIFHTVWQLQHYLQLQQNNGCSIGFVPTMGALHQGHLSLLEQSLQHTDVTVCSIFVNPTQFNDPKEYPVTTSTDVEMLLNAGVQVLFLPSVAEIYPNGTQNPPHYDLGFLETVLEGKYRPGHFQGVCQVMHRLLNIVDADHLFMGQKDYQQCMVIQHLIQTKHIRTQLHIAPTLRETDGLAMSSRNMRLSNNDRLTAVAISEALLQLKTKLRQGNLEQLKLEAAVFLTAKGFRVDYTEIAHAQTLQLMHNWNGSDPLVALTAAYLGEVRLIDNMLLAETD